MKSTQHLGKFTGSLEEAAVETPTFPLSRSVCLHDPRPPCVHLSSVHRHVGQQVRVPQRCELHTQDAGRDQSTSRHHSTALHLALKTRLGMLQGRTEGDGTLQTPGNRTHRPVPVSGNSFPRDNAFTPNRVCVFGGDLGENIKARRVQMGR